MKLKHRKFSAEEISTVESRVRLSTHAKQRDFIFDPARWISLLCGRGAGKTFAVLCRLILAMLRGDPVTSKGANCLYIAKNREQARGIVWSDLKDLIDRMGFTSLAMFDETRAELHLCNRSSLKLLGFDERDEIEKPRGKTWHEVAIDESGSARSDLLARLIDEVIGPRLVGSIILLGTPGYLLDGPFYEATRDGSDQHRPYDKRDEEWPEGWLWSFHSWSVRDGADAGIAAIAVLYENQLEDKRRKGYSDSNPKWLREQGKWALDNTTTVYAYRAHDDGGTEFNQWTPIAKSTDSTRWARLPPAYNPKTWGHALVMDVGFKDAFALEAFAWSYDDPSRWMWHIGEIYKTKQATKAVARMLLGDGLDAARPGGIIGELGWPDIMAGDFSGQGDRFLEDMRNDYGLVIKAVDKHAKYKDPAIEIVNADMFEGRFKILAGSALAKELVTLQWVQDANGKRIENPNQPNHACDGMLYFRVCVTPLLPAAAAAAAAQTNATIPTSDQRPQVSRAAPESKIDADGFSSDAEGWTSGDEMDGWTEGSWGMR